MGQPADQSGMKYFIIAFTLFGTLGCGSSWIIRQNANGGVIGYQGYSDSLKARAAIAKLVNCPDTYVITDDSLVSNEGTMMMPQTTIQNTSGTVYGSGGQFATYQGSGTQTQYIPVAIRRYWREATYECRDYREPAADPQNP